MVDLDLAPQKSDDVRTRVERFRKQHRTSLLTLLFTDLEGSTRLKQEFGDERAVEMMKTHEAVVREVLVDFGDAQEISTAGDSFFIVFARPSDAVACALRVQAGMRITFSADESPLKMRVGVHLGEVVVEERAGRTHDLYGLQVDTAARVMSLAVGGQILCSRSVFDNARQVLMGRNLPGVGTLSWMTHGPYVVKGVEDPIEICEVGEEDGGVLKAPPPGEKARPVDISEEELGWRPAPDGRLPDTDWTIVEKLGEGGFGEVWLAQHLRSKEKRVFKFCFLKEKARALKRELALFRLIREKFGDHPGIVRLLEVHLEEAPYYLGMEFVQGDSLRVWLEKENRLRTLPTRVKLEIAAQVADALDIAHRAGVIHQDLKPQNILVDITAGSPRVKLADFGVGRVAGEEFLRNWTMTGGGATLLRTTGSGSESGTLLYMAPERVEGKGARPQSDLYSLGIVLFQMIVGDLDRAVTSDWENDVRDPVVRKDLRRLLAGNPDRRFKTGGEAAKRFRTWAIRRRLGTLARVGGAAAFVLLTVLGTWGYFSKRLSDAQKRADEEADLRRTAVAASQQAQISRLEAEENARSAQNRLAEGLVTKGDILILAERWDEALERYNEAYDLYVQQGDAPTLAELGLWDLYRRASPPLTTYLGHEGYVYDVEVSPDGREALSAGADSTIRLWDLRTGREVRALRGHSMNVFDVAFLPDGRGAISAGADKTLRLWNLRTGLPIRTLNGHTVGVNCVAVSPDGRLAVSGAGGWEEETYTSIGELIVWDVATGLQRHSLPVEGETIVSVAFSPDGRLAVCGGSGGLMKLWDVVTGREVRAFTGHTDSVDALAFSPEGGTILSARSDGSVRLWDVDTGREVRMLDRGRDSFQTVAFSSDGRWLLSPTAHNGLKTWNVDTGFPVRALFGLQGAATALTLSADGRFAMAGTAGGAVHLWTLDTDRAALPLKRREREVAAGALSLAYSPDGRLAVSGAYAGVTLWNVETGSEVRAFSGYEPAQCVAFSSDGQWILSAGQSLKLWEADSGRLVRTFTGTSGTVDEVAFSPDGRWAISAGVEGYAWDDAAAGDGNGEPQGILKLWDVQLGRESRAFTGHRGAARAVAFSPDGLQALSGGEDATARLWDVRTGVEIRSLVGHEGAVTCVAFAPDGARAITGGDDMTLRLWNLATGEPIATLAGHQAGITGVAFSSDGSRVASAAGDLTVRLWDVETGAQLQAFVGHSVSAATVAFSPDGRSVLSGSDMYDGGQILLWEADSGRLVRSFVGRLEGAASDASSAEFSADGRLLLTGGYNGVDLWDVETGRRLRTLSGSSGGAALSRFSADGSKAILSGWSRADVWDLDTGQSVWSFVAETDPETYASAPVAAATDATTCFTARGNAIEIRDGPAGEVRRTLEGHAAKVERLTLSLHDRYLVSVDVDRVIKVWDVAAGREVHSATTTEELWIGVTAFSADERVLLWTTGEEVHARDLEKGRDLGVQKAADITGFELAPDGRWCVMSTYADTMLWTFDSGRVERFPNFTKAYTTPDGRHLLLGTSGGTLQLWDVEKGREVRAFPGEYHGLNAATFARDGRRILWSMTDNPLTVWDITRPTRIRDFEARRASTDEAAALLALGEWYAFQGAYDWAVEILELARGAGATVPSLLLARCYWQSGLSTQAQEALAAARTAGEAPEAYLKLCLNSFAKPQLLRGDELRGKGDLAGAITAYTQAIDFEPLNWEAYARRAEVNYESALYWESASDYSEVIRLRPSYDAHFGHGRALLETWDTSLAITSFTKAIELDPRPAAFLARGRACFANAKYLEAVNDLTRVIGVDPTAEAYLARGRSYFELGVYEESIRDLNEAVRLKPDWESHFERSRALAELGRHEEAAAGYTEALRFDPESAVSYNNRGVAYHNLERWDGAIADYTRAIEINATDPLYPANRGLARRAIGDLAGSQEDFSKQIELDPYRADAYGNRGETRYALADYAGALEDFTRQIELDPSNPTAYGNRGETRYSLGDFAGAVADYDEQLRLDPESAAGYYSRALARYDLGDPEGAVADFNEVLKRVPENPNTLFLLACIYADRADPDRAFDHLARALKAGIDRETVRNATLLEPIRSDPRYQALMGE